jgi:DNA-binding transcriptional ArsR family regulator
VSIVAAIDERLGSVDEEIKELEEQLDGKKTERTKLSDFRDQAQEFDGSDDGGGVASAASPDPVQARRERRRASIPKTPPRRTAHRSRVSDATVKETLDYIAARERTKPGELDTAIGFSTSTRARILKRLADQGKIIAFYEGPQRYLKLAEDDSAPARPQPSTPSPADAAAEHGDRRKLVKDAILEGLKDGPVGAERLKEIVLEGIDGADDGDFSAARRRLASERRIEVRANKLQLTGIQDNSKPLTNLEKEVVDFVGSGRTARETATNCPLLHGNAFTASQVLAALSHRGIVRRRSGQMTGEQAIYELPEEAAA